MSLALIAFVAYGAVLPDTGVRIGANVGFVGSSERVTEVEAHLQVAAWARWSPLSVGLVYENHIGSLGGAHRQEGCNEIGAQQGGCMINPKLLGGELAVHPWRIWHLEPSAFLTSVWVHREVSRQTTTRSDLGIGGGLAVDAVFDPLRLGMWMRYLNYVTYSPNCCGNESSLAIGLRVGWTSGVLDN